MSDIVILGGGFAGMWAALVARRRAVDEDRDFSITLVSKDDHLTLRPRLYEANPERFCIPLKPILEPLDINFVKAVATDIDTNSRYVSLDKAVQGVKYKRLILATGSVLAPLPIEGVDLAFDVDNLDNALKFERNLKETISKLKDPVVAIIGAGFTGIEIAMEMRSRIEVLSDLASAARVILLDRADVVGPELGENPRPEIEAALKSANIETRLGVNIRQIDTTGLIFENGEHLDADIIVISSGAASNPLTKKIEVPRDDFGRLFVDKDLRVKGMNDVFAAGDAAHALVDDSGHVAMMSCQHALTMGRFAGHNAAGDMMGLETVPYRQERYVTCLDLGSAGAVFTSGWDRVVENIGDEAKKRKRNINGNIIYPPTGGREQILAAATLIPSHHNTPVSE